MLACTPPALLKHESSTLLNHIEPEINSNTNTNISRKANTNISQKANTNTKNYLVKIDDDFKLITDCNYLNLEQLEKVIKIYYSSNEIEIFKVANNINLLSTYICLPNSFLTNNEIDPLAFINYFNKFDEIFEYLHIFGNVQKFTNTLHQSVSKNITDPNIISNQSNTISKQSNIIFKHSNFVSTELFDTAGTYINDNIINIDIIKPYSGEIIGDIYSGKIISDIYDYNYEFNSTNYMKLDNFEESLLDFHKNYNIYFNTQFNNVFVIETISDFISSNDKMKKIFPEIIFVSNERLDKEQYEEVNKLTLDIFVNVDDIKSKINKILHDKVIDSKLSIDEIKFLIKKYFHIDTKPEHSIKFSNILEIIFLELKVTDSFINYIKRQLPIILKDLGLNKKRLADGIYWYGLVCKPLESSIHKNKHTNIEKDTPIPIEEFKSKFDKYISERDSDLLSIISSYDTATTTTFLKLDDVNTCDLKTCDKLAESNEKNTMDYTNQEQQTIESIKKQPKPKQPKPKQTIPKQTMPKQTKSKQTNGLDKIIIKI